MPVRDPGSTSNRPPQIADAMPSAGAMAARRSEPEVCAVPGSNSAWLTMRIAEEFMGVPDQLGSVKPKTRQRLTGEPLNWSLVISVELRSSELSRNRRSQGAGPVEECFIRQALPQHGLRPLVSFSRTAMSAAGRDRYRRPASYRG